jgi:hypothetical protein
MYPKSPISPIFSKVVPAISKPGTCGLPPKFNPMPAEQQVKVVNKLIDHLKNNK